MQWTNALSTRPSLEAALSEVVERVEVSLSGDFDLGIVFISAAFTSDYPRLLPLLLDKLPLPLAIGCGGSGIIGIDDRGQVQEVEDEPALSLTVAQLPNVQLHPFQLASDQLPDSDSSPQAWIDRVGVDPQNYPQFILLADTLSGGINELIEGLDFAYPDAMKVGGVASVPVMGNQTGLFFHSDRHPHLARTPQGTLGLALSGNVVMESLVAQGCRPIGQPLRIHEGDRNIILSVTDLDPNSDPQPPLSILQEILQDLSDEDRELAQNALFVGIARDAFQWKLQARDFLVRNLLGVDPRVGAIAVGDRIRPGQRIQFHLRDARTSAEDIEGLFANFAADRHGKTSPIGGLLFSCLGRGQGLYGKPNYDSGVCQRYFSQMPLAGFFCNGEIGPVGGHTYLHGYTSAFAFLRSDR
jgi:small ligand-binding sensory domain FIST